MEWTKRASKKPGPVAIYRTWKIKGTAIRLVESKSLYGLPTKYFAVDGNSIISKHRTKRAATRACERKAKG